MAFPRGFVLRLLGEALLQRRLWGFMAADITDDNDYVFWVKQRARSRHKTSHLRHGHRWGLLLWIAKAWAYYALRFETEP